MRWRILAAAWMILAAGSGCVPMNPEEPQPERVRLTIRNESEFELLEIRTHVGESYREAEDLLAEHGPLADGDTFDIDDFLPPQYVTVIRRVNELGNKVAFTTIRRVNVTKSDHVLWVFQTSFRLLDPESSTGSALATYDLLAEGVNYP